MIAELRPYVSAAVYWLTRENYDQAALALNHINEVLDEQENVA